MAKDENVEMSTDEPESDQPESDDPEPEEVDIAIPAAQLRLAPDGVTLVVDEKSLVNIIAMGRIKFISYFLITFSRF